jgi:hypothetical protein
VISGVTVVTNARVYYTPRAAAALRAPGIPCALSDVGGWFLHNSGVSSREIAKLYLYATAV